MLAFVGIYLIAYLLAPLYGVPDLNKYTQELYWLEILVCELIASFVYIYFREINPRRHIMIFVERGAKGTVLVSLVLSACILIWLALGVVMAIFVRDNTFVKSVLIALWLLAVPVLFYLFFYRGITVYKNKKIRVFNLKVTAYPNGVIEDVRAEELGKISKLIISVNGKENVFSVSSKSVPKYIGKLQEEMTAD